MQIHPNAPKGQWRKRSWTFIVVAGLAFSLLGYQHGADTEISAFDSASGSPFDSPFYSDDEDAPRVLGESVADQAADDNESIDLDSEDDMPHWPSQSREELFSPQDTESTPTSNEDDFENYDF